MSFLKYLNTKFGIIPTSHSTLNMSEMTLLTANANIVYSNGGCEVFYFLGK